MHILTEACVTVSNAVTDRYPRIAQIGDATRVRGLMYTPDEVESLGFAVSVVLTKPTATPAMEVDGAKLQPVRKIFPIYCWAFCGSLVLDAIASDPIAAGGIPARPVLMPPSGIPPSAMVFDASGRCLAPPTCADYEQWRRFLDRYQRNYGQRWEMSNTEPAPPARRAEVAPTPMANIQPAYRYASQVRTEFEQSGRALERHPASGR